MLAWSYLSKSMPVGAPARLAPVSVVAWQDVHLFQAVISLVAIPVNFVASIPGALRALRAGELNSRVPATILIAIGAFFPTLADSLVKQGEAQYHQWGLLFGVLFLLAGFLVSVEVFEEIRVPFTHIVLRTRRRDGRRAEQPGPGGT